MALYNHLKGDCGEVGVRLPKGVVESPSLEVFRKGRRHTESHGLELLQAWLDAWPKAS